MRAGSGEWLIDFGLPEPDPAPVTTIAWRIGHLVVGVFGARAASHFGGPAEDYQTHDYPGDAATALAQLDRSYAAWMAGEEATRGSLTPGKLADLVVLRDDPLTSDPQSLPEVPVLGTFRGGRATHDVGLGLPADAAAVER